MLTILSTPLTPLPLGILHSVRAIDVPTFITCPIYQMRLWGRDS